ncbi:nicotinamide mononucleotide transporter family protein [Corynebacterium sp. 153RC1]|uniref:nicotinamide mononucleotide transporter family protein n=1 Tax=unclassified Corynebacterium TaxID=2624378 RepID=UPI00211BAB0A|nr:nicotinamide mononucleotide transporter family protein [Corynebacterium sp. 209RC1]MCQ9353761.1 nicotinamide mononucleotide transporter family protein [Corynebacterium sp. 1222RC1]MCQ9356255.1 nicotinamide mononucleotide transporter family protein [Corynebacterium sp. 122RC1]MCQ9358357.1 nicotinamide mononucleotide transporter family protein [Corynebacterium sp. 142RC1]MCQ9360908.1 nicotinamide mononucleotide transporter family protein [Corynebacterium sp. 153RC1]MCQ9362842.1 nicotinamide m
MNLLNDFLGATLYIGGVPILWREIVGNAFGLASAIGGMKRVVWAWPVGIIGNVLLFTVFMGGLFHTPQNLDLYGQAGRQVMFIIVSVYGWWTWSRAKRQGLKEHEELDPSRSIVSEPHETAEAVQPHWATNKQRAGMIAFAITGTIVFSWIFSALGSWGPVADAWIFTGSILATYGMARGWTEFWLVWIGVDIVGVPLLLIAGYYPSAALYIVYAAFVIWGFMVWLRVQRQKEPAQENPGQLARVASGS